ncbi:hypothetical protein FQA39_LY07526 [Lamprigera yunnana]|nr:hypothetical protein FQA39_LY07526 [Lamprigera yunnana]
MQEEQQDIDRAFTLISESAVYLDIDLMSGFDDVRSNHARKGKYEKFEDTPMSSMKRFEIQYFNELMDIMGPDERGGGG